MKPYGFFSFGLAALLILSQFMITPFHNAGGSFDVYVFAIALLHAIFGIWFFKGKDSLPFMRASGMSRLVIGFLFLTLGIAQTRTQGTVNLFLAVYLLLQGAVDFFTGGLTLWQVRRRAVTERVVSRLSIEYCNRFLFALYMIALSAWILVHAASFTDFFRLPPVSTQVGPHSQIYVLHLFAILLLQLAFFNLVAVRHRIAPLIAAGMRGGLFTCVFVLILVVLRVVHPVVLLLPGVDLISIAAIGITRLRRRNEAQL